MFRFRLDKFAMISLSALFFVVVLGFAPLGAKLVPRPDPIGGTEAMPASPATISWSTCRWPSALALSLARWSLVVLVARGPLDVVPQRRAVDRVCRSRKGFRGHENKDGLSKPDIRRLV